MNSCVQDAVSFIRHSSSFLWLTKHAFSKINLGWKLALVYKGYSSPSLLDTYGEERLPVIAEMLGKTTELFNQAKVSGGEIKRGSELRQLAVNYRGSSIVYEDDVKVATEKGIGYNTSSETDARPGDRAPGAPGLKVVNEKEEKNIIIHDVFSADRHTVLLFSKVKNMDFKPVLDVLQGLPAGTVRTVLILSQGTGLPMAGVFDKVLVDEDGYAYTGYHIGEETSIIVVRPDGIVGARARSEAGLKKYFQNIFQA